MNCIEPRRFSSVLIVGLLIAVVSQLVSLAGANWLIPVSSFPPPAPTVTVVSPENARSYNSESVRLHFVVNGANWNRYGFLKLTWIGYSLDENPKTAFVGENETIPDVNDLMTRFSADLTGLSVGNHSLTVYARGEGLYSLQAYEAINYSEYCSSPKIFFETQNITPATTPAPTSSLQLSPLLSPGSPFSTAPPSASPNPGISTTASPKPSLTPTSSNSAPPNNPPSNNLFFLGVSIVTAVMGFLALTEAFSRLRKQRR